MATHSDHTEAAAWRDLSRQLAEVERDHQCVRRFSLGGYVKRATSQAARREAASPPHDQQPVRRWQPRPEWRDDLPVHDPRLGAPEVTEAAPGQGRDHTHTLRCR